MVSLFDYFMPSVQAEEPKQDAEGETHQESGDEEKADTGSEEGKGEVVESGESKEDADEEEAPAEEEEEEEEEPEDAAPAIQEGRLPVTPISHSSGSYGYVPVLV